MKRREFLSSAMACVVCKGAAQVVPTRAAARRGGRIAAPPVNHSIWLRSYAGHRADLMLRAPRFREFVGSSLLKASIDAKIVKDLDRRLISYSGVPGTVDLSWRRYLIASPCMAHCGFNRTFVWIDAHPQSSTVNDPAFVVATIEVDGAKRKLSLITNQQLRESECALPSNFQKTFAKWIDARGKGTKLAGGRINVIAIAHSGRGGSPLTFGSIGLPEYKCQSATTVSLMV